MASINRRTMPAITAAACPGLLATGSIATAAEPAAAEPIPVNVRIWSAGPQGAFRNIFAIETETGFVVVDAPLRRSDGAAAGAWLRSLGRPVHVVLLSHMHPDHTFGLTQMLRGGDAPVIATHAVAAAIEAADAEHRRLVPGFIGDAETETDRRFPDARVAPGETVRIDGVHFEALDVGEAESGADSVWSTPSMPWARFSGDLVFHRVHSWVAQGATGRYLSVLARLRAASDPATLFFAGHGGVAPAAAIARQETYLTAFRESVAELADGRPALTEHQKKELARRMQALEPSPVLAFGIGVGADAVARELAEP